MPQYKLVKTEALSNVAVVIDGELYVTDSASNPRFDEIVELLERGETPPVALFDLTLVVSQRFESLSERVTVNSGRVYFDGDEVDTSLTRQIVRLVDEDVEDWNPLVRFLENLYQNPEQHSREQLYDWLKARDTTLTEDGCFLAYKGVDVGREDEDGEIVYHSVHAGTATVDGVLYENRKIPQKVGSVVTMPRSGVEHNPSNACSVGLHAGTHSYASDYGQILLTVKINPRDVASVPTDAQGEKLRVCRYEVLEVNEREYDSAVHFDASYHADDSWDVYDYDYDYDDRSGWEFVAPATFTTTTTTTTGSSTGANLTVNSQAKLGWNEVDKIREAHKLGYSVKRLSEDYDVSERTIQRIVANQAWVR